MVFPMFSEENWENNGKQRLVTPILLGFVLLRIDELVLPNNGQHLFFYSDPGMAKHWPIYHSPMDEWPGIPPKKNMANTYNLNHKPSQKFAQIKLR